MYKELLNKGFQPVYYTNSDWFESRKCDTRLFYRYIIEDKNILSIILQILEIYDQYFSILEDDECTIQIEVDEALEEYWIYFENTDLDSYQIPNEKIKDALSSIPNRFMFECQ